MNARALWGLALVAACKLEPVESLELAEQPGLELPSRVQPWSLESESSDADAARWEQTLVRALGFLTGPELKGRRPGTPDAGLTVGFVISELERAGLSPNGPDLGWTQAVGIRVVETKDASVTIRYSKEEGAKGPKALSAAKGLWLRHRGAAGSRALTLQIVTPHSPVLGPSGQAKDLERLLAVPPPTSPDGLEPGAAYREVFDDAWHEGMSVAVLPIPRDDEAALAAAERWREPDVQSLFPGRDPPAALDIQGFVEPELHAALVEAASRGGSTVELRYEATERWFQDDNVIGRIAGGRRPEQAVVVVAHWDAGGLSAPDPEGGGAVANAGGLAVLLALAQRSARWQAAGRRPERSLVFVASAAGSLGHRGAARFVEASGIRPENIVAVINLERLGGIDAELRVVDGARSDLGRQIGELEAATHLVVGDGPGHGHVAFLERGIPSVTLTRPSVENREDGVEPPLSLATLRADAQLVLRLLWTLADQAETPRLSEPDPPLDP